MTPQHWLLVRGTGARPLPGPVDPEAIRRHGASRRPAVQRGDRALLYAAGWQVVFAEAEVVGDPQEDPPRERWRWRFPIRVVLAIDDLRGAPPVEAAGIFPSSLARHSHMRLTEEGYATGRDAIRDARLP